MEDEHTDRPRTLETAPRSDEELLREFVRGGQSGKAALGELASRHEQALLGLATGLLRGDRERAMEVVQDAWVRVIRFGGSFQGKSSVRTWLYRIVINGCNDAQSKRLRERASMNGRAGAEQAAAGANGPTSLQDHGGALRAALDSVTDDQRLILLLCYHRGLTHEQAADVLGIPVGTLKSRQHAAMTALRGAMSGAGAGVHGEATP